MFFVAGYLLLDAAGLRRRLVGLVTARYERDAAELWETLSQERSPYVSGLALTLAVEGALSALALWALGVPYAILLGAWVSLTGLIPTLGAYLGGIPAVLLALFQSPATALLTVVLFVAIQQLESNVLIPRSQAGAVHVHPVAVPALAVLRVVWDFFRARIVVR